MPARREDQRQVLRWVREGRKRQLCLPGLRHLEVLHRQPRAIRGFEPYPRIVQPGSAGVYPQTRFRWVGQPVDHGQAFPLVFLGHRLAQQVTCAQLEKAGFFGVSIAQQLCKDDLHWPRKEQPDCQQQEQRRHGDPRPKRCGAALPGSRGKGSHLFHPACLEISRQRGRGREFRQLVHQPSQRGGRRFRQRGAAAQAPLDQGIEPHHFHAVKQHRSLLPVRPAFLSTGAAPDTAAPPRGWDGVPAAARSRGCSCRRQT